MSGIPIPHRPGHNFRPTKGVRVPVGLADAPRVGVGAVACAFSATMRGETLTLAAFVSEQISKVIHGCYIEGIRSSTLSQAHKDKKNT